MSYIYIPLVLFTSCIQALIFASLVAAYIRKSIEVHC